jgi:Ca2+-binding RTX toxin-like protein
MKRFNSNRFSIEPLERREMMAADAVLAGGVLSIKGTEQADHIVVSPDIANGLAIIRVSITNIDTGASLLEKSFFNGSVSSIQVECFGGDDVAENHTLKKSTMYGDNGEDKLVGGGAADTLFGGRIYDQVENDGNTLIGNGGHDKLYGTSEEDTLEGGAGEDELMGGRDNDTLRGGANNDKLWGNLGNDTLYGDDGNDTLYGLDASCGDDDANHLYGGNGHDTIFGAMGADYCYGEAGNDTIHGGAGNDDLFGGAGNDTIYGGEGGDEIFGEGGDDSIHGNNGEDNCQGGTGNDFVAGGDGFDTLNGDSDVISGAADSEIDTLIFDFYDIGVDGHLGSFQWGIRPKLASGAYKGHSVYND